MVSGFACSFIDLTAYFENQSLEADEYFWDFGDGYFSDLPDPVHTYDAPGSHTVCLVAGNACGYDTLCRLLDPTWVIEVTENYGIVKIYPNPAKNLIHIISPITGSAVVNVIDLCGKTVLRKDIPMPEINDDGISLKGLSPGIYLLKINQGKYLFSDKLIICR